MYLNCCRYVLYNTLCKFLANLYSDFRESHLITFPGQKLFEWPKTLYPLLVALLVAIITASGCFAISNIFGVLASFSQFWLVSVSVIDSHRESLKQTILELNTTTVIILIYSQFEKQGRFEQEVEYFIIKVHKISIDIDIDLVNLLIRHICQVIDTYCHMNA